MERRRSSQQRDDHVTDGREGLGIEETDRKTPSVHLHYKLLLSKTCTLHGAFTENKTLNQSNFYIHFSLLAYDLYALFWLNDPTLAVGLDNGPYYRIKWQFHFTCRASARGNPDPSL